MKTSPLLQITPVVVFALTLFQVPQTFATLDEIKDRGADIDKSLRNLDRQGSFGAGGGGFVPDDWERDASAGFLGGGEDQESYEKSVDRERKKIDKRHKANEEAEQQHQWDLDKAQDDSYREEKERKERLEKLNKEKLDQQRAESERELDRFKKNAGPQDKWTNEQKAEYEKLVQKNAALFEPTAEESEEIEKHQQTRENVAHDIRQSAYNMGKLSEDEVAERKLKATQSDLATKGWRDFTFTGKMVSEVKDDIFRQRERGIFSNNMIFASDLYLKRTDITQEQRQIAEQIRANNVTARGFAADAISKDMAVIGLGVASDVGMLGIGRAVSSVVGFVGKTIRGGGGGVPTPGGGGTGTAGQEAGQAGGQAAGQKAGQAAGQAADDYQKAADAAYKQYGSFDKAADELIGGADDVVMPLEAKAAQAEFGAIKASASKLSPAEVEKLFEKGANLTPTQIIQKAELLKSGFQPPSTTGGATPPGTGPSGFNPPPGWSEGGTVIDQVGGQAAGGATQKFGGVLPLPGQGGGPTQQFGGVLPIPGQGAGSAAGGATQQFGGVLPIPGQGAGSAASGSTQAFGGVLPLPNPPGTVPPVIGATAATEAPTVVGNIARGQATGPTAGGSTQIFNQVLPTPSSGQASSGAASNLPKSGK